MMPNTSPIPNPIAAIEAIARPIPMPCVLGGQACLPKGPGFGSPTAVVSPIRLMIRDRSRGRHSFALFLPCLSSAGTADQASLKWSEMLHCTCARADLDVYLSEPKALRSTTLRALQSSRSLYCTRKGVPWILENQSYRYATGTRGQHLERMQHCAL